MSRPDFDCEDCDHTINEVDLILDPNETLGVDKLDDRVLHHRLSPRQRSVTERRVMNTSTRTNILPGETVEGCTVIASVYFGSDADLWAVLLLGQAPPFYRIALVELDTLESVEWSEPFENIVPAVEAWQSQWGGDY